MTALRPGHAARRRVAAVALSTVLAAAAGCGGGTSGAGDPAADASSSAATGPRAVTPDEADRLAVARFNNYDRGTVPLRMTLPTEGGQVLELVGRVDLREHRGLAAFTTDDQPPSAGVLAWDFATLALLPTAAPVAPDALDATVRQDGWQAKPAERGDPLAAALAVVLNLATDRPDNAQLLRQNGAQWQADTVVDGTAVAVMTATPQGEGQSVTYYVDERGNLLRADVETGAEQPARIDFPTGDAAPLPRIPALRAGGGQGQPGGQAG